jgi:hypothetical protein
MTIRQETIDVTALLRECFGETVSLVKDLQEHERICTACKGLGVIRREQVFGMSDEPYTSRATAFPYTQEYVAPCPNCYKGVEVVCEYCGEALHRGYTSGAAWCNCKGATDERSRVAREKEQARLAKAKRVKLADYDGEMVFDDTYETFEDAFGGDLDHEHLYYACDPSTNWIEPAAKLLIDDLNNRAAEEYEDFEDLDITKEAQDKLQELLEVWFRDNVTLPVLYYPDQDTIVEVPEPEYDDEDEDEDEEGEEQGGP